jgi:hypothetical protein
LPSNQLDPVSSRYPETGAQELAEDKGIIAKAPIAEEICTLENGSDTQQAAQQLEESIATQVIEKSEQILPETDSKEVVDVEPEEVVESTQTITGETTKEPELPEVSIQATENETSETIVEKKAGTVSSVTCSSTAPMTKTVCQPLDFDAEIAIIAASERTPFIKSTQQAGSSFATNSASSEAMKAES